MNELVDVAPDDVVTKAKDMVVDVSLVSVEGEVVTEVDTTTNLVDTV